MDTNDAARREAVRELLEELRTQVDHEANAAMDARFLQAAQTTVGLWRQWWSHTGSVPAPGPSAIELKFRMVYPLAQHALNNVAAALDLITRLPWVAAGLARTAFEHALTAQWVLLTHDGEQELRLEFANESHKRVRQFHKGLGSPEQYAALVGKRPSPSSWSVANACARFTDAPELFYDIYRDLNTATHPSYGTVLAHLDVTSDGAVAGLVPAGSASPSDEVPRALGLAALWALDALEELRQGRPNVAQLTEVGNAAELPTCLRDSDQHPELQEAPQQQGPAGRAGSPPS